MQITTGPADGPDTASGPILPPEVLIVDDEPLLAEELALAVEDADLAAITASSATEAFRCVQRFPSLLVVVTDIRMPQEDGLRLAARLKAARAEAQALEIVVMTGHATLEDAAAAVRAGAFDFLRKPFALSHMIEVIGKARARALLRREEAERRDAQSSRLDRAEAEKAALLSRDTLTATGNRPAFRARLEAMRRPGAAVAVIDVDRFSRINAVAGDAVGDELLKRLAERLEMQFGADAFIARTGGDEFAVAFEQPDANTGTLGLRLGEIRKALERPFPLAGKEIVVSTSAGFALRATAGATPLDTAAGVALKAAKAAGGGWVLFEPAMHAASARRLEIEQALPRAIAENQLRLVYQPIFQPATRRLLGFEALARWRHPTLGELSPAEFIGIAEDGGAIMELGRWLNDAAARQAAAWRQAGRDDLYVALNMSVRQFAQSEALADLLAAVRQHGLSPRHLVVEITETVATGPQAAGMLEAMRAAGFRIALDDFGTGFSSLAALSTLPLDLVKFDRSLLPADQGARRQQQLFRGLVAALRGLGLTVTAEGVETAEQLAMVAETGCDGAQGYFLARPMTAAEATALLGQG